MNPIRAIGIIMDGNRRFAKAHSLPSVEGHRKGMESLRTLSKHLPAFRETYGLEYVYLYAFSTENWNRTPVEVKLLMELFEKGFSEILSDTEDDTQTARRIRIIGERHRFSPKLQKLMTEAEQKTEENGGATVVFCLSYGGRAEILDAANRLIAKGKAVDEKEFSDALWSGGMPDPDLIIRTGGDTRLSNFLPWQSVYSELFFTETLWPAFTARELEDILDAFRSRKRNFGS